MKRKLVYISQLLFPIVIVMATVVGCAESSQTSKYPAEISGRVTIAEKVVYPEVNDPFSPSEGNIWWIAEVSVRNISYAQPIEPDFIIPLVPDAWMDVLPPYPEAIPTGYSGQFTLLFEMPLSYNITNSQICYEGQTPTSCGKLSKKGNVPLYNSVSPTPKPSPTSNTESYLVNPYGWSANMYMQLKTVASWQGTSSKKMKFTATQVPCIINYGWTPTSAISSYVAVSAWDKDNISPIPGLDQSKGIWMIELDKEGTYTIELEAVGAAWWLKIGVEP